MALLAQSDLWPIHTARNLHSRAQLSYLWQFSVFGKSNIIDRDLTMLAVSCSIPGITFEKKEYSVGGQKHAHLGATARGGNVEAKFLEVEGGFVDFFFRRWAEEVDIPATGTEISGSGGSVPAAGYERSAQGGVTGAQGHTRGAILTTYRRLGTVSAQYELKGLKLVSFGVPAMAYETSGPLVVPVTMWCDEVKRK